MAHVSHQLVHLLCVWSLMSAMLEHHMLATSTHLCVSTRVHQMQELVQRQVVLMCGQMRVMLRETVDQIWCVCTVDQLAIRTHPSHGVSQSRIRLQVHHDYLFIHVWCVVVCVFFWKT